MKTALRLSFSTSLMLLMGGPLAHAGTIKYNLNFAYTAQPTDSNSHGAWSGSFNKSVDWNQSSSYGFNESVDGVGVNATIAGSTTGALAISGKLQAADSTVSASLGGELLLTPLSSPGAGIARIGTNYAPTYTKLQTSVDNVEFNSTLALAMENGVGASAKVGPYGFSGNLTSSGGVANPNLGAFAFGSSPLTYNQNGNGKVSVFGSPSFSLPGNGLTSVPVGFTGVSAKVDVNPSVNTSGYNFGSNTATSFGFLPTAAQFSFASNAADLISPLPFAAQLTGDLGSVIPNPKSSDPFEELAYEAAEAVLGGIGYDALEADVKLSVGYETSYSLAPSQELDYNLHVEQTGQNISGNTNTGYADINTDGLTHLTIDPTVELVNPVFTETSFLTITPEIDVEALKLDGFGKSLGPLVDESYSPITFMIPLPTATGSMQLAGSEQIGLRPYELDLSSSASAAPEPATVILLGAGLIGIGLVARRKS